MEVLANGTSSVNSNSSRHLNISTHWTQLLCSMTELSRLISITAQPCLESLSQKKMFLYTTELLLLSGPEIITMEPKMLNTSMAPILGMKHCLMEPSQSYILRLLKHLQKSQMPMIRLSSSTIMDLLAPISLLYQILLQKKSWPMLFITRIN